MPWTCTPLEVSRFPRLLSRLPRRRMTKLKSLDPCILEIQCRHASNDTMHEVSFLKHGRWAGAVSHTEEGAGRNKERALLLTPLGLPLETHPKGDLRAAAERQVGSSTRHRITCRKSWGSFSRWAQMLSVWSRKRMFGVLYSFLETPGDLPQALIWVYYILRNSYFLLRKQRSRK